MREVLVYIILIASINALLASAPTLNYRNEDNITDTISERNCYNIEYTDFNRNTDIFSNYLINLKDWGGHYVYSGSISGDTTIAGYIQQTELRLSKSKKMLKLSFLRYEAVNLLNIIGWDNPDVSVVVIAVPYNSYFRFLFIRLIDGMYEYALIDLSHGSLEQHTFETGYYVFNGDPSSLFDANEKPEFFPESELAKVSYSVGADLYFGLFQRGKFYNQFCVPIMSLPPPAGEFYWELILFFIKYPIPEEFYL